MTTAQHTPQWSHAANLASIEHIVPLEQFMLRPLPTHLLLIVSLLTTSAAFGQDDETWMKVEIDGKPVGYEYSKQIEDGSRTINESTSLVRINRFGQNFEMKTLLTLIEDDSKLVSFRLEQQSPGQPAQISRGKVEGNQIRVTSTSNGRESSKMIPLAADVLSPSEADRILSDSPPEQGRSVKIKVFSVETLAPTTITLTGLGQQSTKLTNGSTERRTAVAMTRSDLPMKNTIYLDKSGDAEKIEFDLGVMKMVGWSTTREEALAAAEGNSTIDLGKRTILKITPYPGLSRLDEATYRVSGATLPTSQGSQSVSSDGDASLVRVASPAVANAKAAGNVDKKYLASTRWVDWQDAGVQKIAGQLGDKSTAGQLAESAERLVGRAISKKSFGVGFATASEVAATREGDCTEHGVLLAAVLRASGLPARVCYGLVYVESMAAMVPHMWTEVALDNAWIPLDATRPGLPNAGYLKFGDSALDSDASLPIGDLLKLSQDLGKMSVSVVETAVPAKAGQ